MQVERLGKTEAIDAAAAPTAQPRGRPRHHVVGQGSGWRVDSLRAIEARTQPRLREAGQDAWVGYVAELARAPDELEVEMAISEAQLDAELSADRVTLWPASRPSGGRP